MKRTFAVLACGYPGDQNYGAIGGYLQALEDMGILSGVKMGPELERRHPHYETLQAIAARLHPDSCRLVTFAEVRSRAAFGKRIPDLSRRYDIRTELYTP